MELIGGPSWQINTGIDQGLSLILYVRDVTGLERYVLGESDLSPVQSVLPGRTTIAELHSQVDLRVAIREWEIWWTRTVRAPTLSLRPHPPEWHGLDDVPSMRVLASQHFDGFQTWIGQVYADEAEPDLGDEPLDLTRFVNDYKKALRRPVRPFNLTIRELPLREAGGWILNPNNVLMSTRLREDPDKFRSFLQPVIEALV